MNCDAYMIRYEREIIARGMTLETALVLLKALFLEYWREKDIYYTIEREAPAECEGEQE